MIWQLSSDISDNIFFREVKSDNSFFYMNVFYMEYVVYIYVYYTNVHMIAAAEVVG